MAVTDQVFRLQPYGGVPFSYVVVTPEPMDADKVTAAWAYAIRYTAKGLDLPDHQAALEMLVKRHPSWKVLESRASPIQVNLALADTDTPDAP